MTECYTYRVSVINEQTVRTVLSDPQNRLVDEGEGEGQFRYTGARRQQIKQLLDTAVQNPLTEDQIKQLGEALFNALFDPVLRQKLAEHYNDIVHGEQKLLRLELDVDEKTLSHVAALPWELMCLPQEANLGVLWLASAPNFIFSRRRSQWFIPNPVQLQKNEKLKIGLVVASPPGLPPIDINPIQTALQKLAEQPGSQFELLPTVTAADAPKIDDLLTQEPHILHFVGYGRYHQEGDEQKHQVAFVDTILDNVDWANADIFSDLLNQHRPPVVLLQACVDPQNKSAQAFAGIAANVVAQNVPVVVATQYQMDNDLAVRFALRFYKQLAEGDPVDRAAQVARRDLALRAQYKTTDFASPLLYMRVRDGRLFDRKITENETPEPVKQAQALREVLVQLNYNQQRGQLAALQYKPKMSTFLISGPNQLSGQRWLLNLLVKEDLKGEFIDGKSVRLDIAQKLTSQDVQRLWVALARGLNLPWTTSQEEIVEGMYEMWQERDLLIILDNVCHLGTAFPEIVLQQVWQPLVKRFNPRADSNWCLLFMLDNEGKLVAQGQNGDNIGDPARPVWLPPLKERFEADELGNWLGQWATQKALEKARQKLNPTSPDDFRAQLLALTDNGVPMFFVSELCSLCDHNWGTLKGQWLTL
ncbi:MAG: hypothetical protein CL608_00925 [Anaerolineaceae bacterium]|nr:hypothetical protein [Anaerolineaceae bacterium]